VPSDEAEDQDRPARDRPTYVVGDIHGRADLLELLLGLIDAHIGGTATTQPHLVFVGDYIDHGPESAETLARLRELTRDFPDQRHVPDGQSRTHAARFPGRPGDAGPALAARRRCGDAPGASASTRRPLSDRAADDFREAARRLDHAMPEGLRDWMAALPLSWRSGNLWAVHAGADPAHPMDAQSARVLLWGHPEFEAVPRADGSWVAHGHTEMERPVYEDGRIALDTGAWRTGRLTACAIRTDGQHDFLQT
jgi:serine/threonine protein phosphatase 1